MTFENEIETCCILEIGRRVINKYLGFIRAFSEFRHMQSGEKSKISEVEPRMCGLNCHLYVY